MSNSQSSKNKFGKMLLIYIPGNNGLPAHMPIHFGQPLNVAMKPNVPTVVNGHDAKVMLCQHGNVIFRCEEDGTVIKDEKLESPNLPQSSQPPQIVKKKGTSK